MREFLRFVFCLAMLTGLFCASGCQNKPPSLVDDGGGRKPSDFPELEVDVFQPMDGGIELAPAEIKGRNTWNLWCGGNEQFWDRIAREGYGLFDLLKMIDSRKRDTRFKDMGLINQPGFRRAEQADKYGLWIDEGQEPQSDKIDPAVYGRSTGIMGFRLFDNPAFKGEAIKKWNGEKFYNDSAYAAQADLVRPYRVGVACGSCHIAFHPTRPTADPENPQWDNLASAIGNQYIHEGQVFAHNVKQGGFFWEMLNSQPHGTSDTSRIATDHINNPNAINPIFDIGSRLLVAGAEKLDGESLSLPDAKEKIQAPRILKDGADSVGVSGATLRVYVNIGMFSQHWLEQHEPLIGLTRQKPFSVHTAQKNSVYWRATEQKFGNVIKFFSRLKPFRLEDAPSGRDFMTKDEAMLSKGKLVFAEKCARCHSSKRPPADVDEHEWFRQEAVKPDFRQDNFYSNEERYSVAEIGTNSARACGTNATQGHIWQNFSSKSYKSLPSVGEIEVWNPYHEQNESFRIPGGGPGYYRTPSLISLWSSAPFFHNNMLGIYNGDPSVSGRMAAFNDAVDKLLWPEKRLGHNSIWRTTQPCTFEIHSSLIHQPLRSMLHRHVDSNGYFHLGPIPTGMPINLLANLDPQQHLELVAGCDQLAKALVKIKLEGLDTDASRELLKETVAPHLLKASTCPDLVEDRGHLFGTELPDDDKRALIEYLKTL